MEIWTTEKLANKAQVNPSYIRQEIWAGNLPAKKYSGVWIISDEDARAWIQAREKRLKKGVRRKYKERKK